MLDYSTVRSKFNNSEVDSKVKDLYNTFSKANKDGGIANFEVFSFHPMTKKFGFKLIKKFTPFKANQKVIKITLDMGKDAEGKAVTYSVVLSATSHLYVNANGHPTTIAAHALRSWRTGRLAVGFLAEDNKTVKFYPVINVSDPVAEVEQKNANLQAAHKVIDDSKIKKKTKKPTLAEIPYYEVYKIETFDNSYVVVDRLIMK